MPKDPFDRAYAISLLQLQTLNRVNDSLEEISSYLDRSVQGVKTVGYKNHWFTSFAYIVGNQTIKDVYDDLYFPEVPQVLIAAPTTDCFIEFDRDIDTSHLQPVLGSTNQTLSSPLVAHEVHAQGQTAAGTLALFGFW